MKKVSILVLSLVLMGGFMFSWLKKSAANEGHDFEQSHLASLEVDKVDWHAKDKSYWQKVLTPLQYTVTREAGTERAFTGKYWDNKEAGTYICSNCGQALFDADTKYKSGTGWPSFWKAISKGAIKENVDTKTNTNIMYSLACNWLIFSWFTFIWFVFCLLSKGKHN